MRIGIAVSALALVLALAASGLWLAARIWPERLCDPRLEVNAQRDARSSGYLLRAGDERALRPAIYDLVQGRVRFFERETAAGLLRYQLGDARSRHCLRRALVEERIEGLPLPAGQCVQVRPAARTESRYRVDAEHAWAASLRGSRIVDLQEDVTLAQYHRSRLVPAAWLELACTTTQPGLHGGFASITGFVFQDRWGRLLRSADIRKDAGGNLPPVSEVRARLAWEGRLNRHECHLPGWMGETELHQIELPGGPLEVSARLDAQSNSAGVVLLDVHTPDKAVVIIARAQRPTIWHVHESAHSSLVAFIVRGEGGQAVLGLTPSTRILMSTREHNPATHCSAAELERIEHDLSTRYGRPRQHRQEVHEGKPVVRYSIGEPMTDGSLLFHHDSELSDFEVRED